MNNLYLFDRAPKSKYIINDSAIIGRFGVIILLGLAFLSLASCGGGGGSSSGPPSMTITPPTPEEGQPDLVIDATESTEASGQEIGLLISVSNRGTGRAPATTLRFKSHTSLPIVESNPTVGTDSVQSLGPSEAVTFTITLPRPSTPGTYYYGACVDAVSGESDTTNNCSGDQGVRVTVGDQSPPSGGADLVIHSTSVSDDSLAPGQQFDLTITVRNIGEGPAAATTLRYKSHTSLPIVDSNPTLITRSVPSFDPSQEYSETISLSAPATPGIYYYGACVDAISGESNTSNNCSGDQGVRVTVGSGTDGGGPDLVIHSASVSNDSLAPGERFDLTVTVRNVGEGQSAATTLRYKSHTSLPIVESNPTLITRPVPSFDPSQEYSGTISLTAPSTPGTYYYGACVDVVSGESDTTTNCSGDQGVRVTVSSGTDGGGPDGRGEPVTTAVWPCPFGDRVIQMPYSTTRTERRTTYAAISSDIDFPGGTCGNFSISLRLNSHQGREGPTGDGGYLVKEDLGAEILIVGVNNTELDELSGGGNDDRDRVVFVHRHDVVDMPKRTTILTRQYHFIFCDRTQNGYFRGRLGESCIPSRSNLPLNQANQVVDRSATVTVHWLPPR